MISLPFLTPSFPAVEKTETPLDATFTILFIDKTNRILVV